MFLSKPLFQFPLDTCERWISIQDFYGNVDVLSCSGVIFHSWGLLLLRRDLVRGYRRHPPWLPRSYVRSPSNHGTLLTFQPSDELSRVGI